ncbi:hypothetical protein [Aeromonas phage vB_ AhaP_PT2]|uniref:Uncharacterized protein n=1 Tax=Aeromonas phage vB_ AhaP_PT2 TaxID=2924715 RepID=A0AC61TT50_9CAUD|nr:hypothetical protein [Aeromonas phage vB_ AhaP_PT2]
MQYKKYIIHYTSPYSDYEMTMPIFAADIGSAAEWAEETLEKDNFLTVTRIRPAV